MPTERPRHVLTETDDVARALAQAARRWPQDAGRPSRLLLRLVAEGERALTAAQSQEVAARRRAVRTAAGAATGLYGAGYLDELRAEWDR